jgi:hypothetical protein
VLAVQHLGISLIACRTALNEPNHDMSGLYLLAFVCIQMSHDVISHAGVAWNHQLVFAPGLVSVLLMCSYLSVMFVH